MLQVSYQNFHTSKYLALYLNILPTDVKENNCKSHAVDILFLISDLE